MSFAAFSRLCVSTILLRVHYRIIGPTSRRDHNWQSCTKNSGHNRSCTSSALRRRRRRSTPRSSPLRVNRHRQTYGRHTGPWKHGSLALSLYLVRVKTLLRKLGGFCSIAKSSSAPLRRMSVVGPAFPLLNPRPTSFERRSATQKFSGSCSANFDTTVSGANRASRTETSQGSSFQIRVVAAFLT